MASLWSRIFGCGCEQRLSQVEAKLTELERKQKQMADETKSQFETVIKKIDDATTEVANDLRDIRERLKEVGLSAADEAAILAKLQSAADRLTAIGADPADPVPVS